MSDSQYGSHVGDDDITDWGNVYRARRPLHEEFTVELHRLLERILLSRDLDVSQIQQRTKTVESFLEKLERRNHKYSDPLKQVTDLSGIRVILLNRDDCPKVTEVIKHGFEVDVKNSQPMLPPAEPDRFGYRRDHYVIQLGPDLAMRPEWERFLGLKAEVQIRTLISHAWAELDHRLRYKNQDDVPLEVQRRIYQMNAALETADADIADLIRASAARRSEYDQAVGLGHLSIEVDAYSLMSYLEADVVADWVETAIRVKYARPTQRSAGDERVAQLRMTLSKAGVASLERLDEILRSAAPWGEQCLAVIRDTAVASFDDPADYFSTIWAHPSDIVHLLVLCHFKEPALVERLDTSVEIQTGLYAAFRCA